MRWPTPGCPCEHCAAAGAIDDHPCICISCELGRFELPPDRLGEHHAAVRFSGRDCWLFVTLDGVPESYAVEALAGEDGWVLRVRLPVHSCRFCWAGACLEKVHGSVTISSHDRR